MAQSRRSVLGRMAGLMAGLAVWAAAGCGPSSPPAPVIPPPPPPVPLDLSGAVVVGASVSDGFGALLPGKKAEGLLPIGVPLAETLGAIATAHAGPASFTSSLFFLSPEQTAESQLADAKAKSPTVVVAIDYLFWHAYGEMEDSQRLPLLQKGLDRLGSLGVPLIIADLPDMSHAVGKMLSPGQVPKPETLTALNAAISAWAGARPNVVVVPFGGVVREAMQSGTVRVGGKEFTGPAARGLLTRDGLHATLDGQVVVALEALAKARDAGVLPKNSVWETDPAKVIETLQAAAAKNPG